jgi:hypothetical protein
VLDARRRKVTKLEICYPTMIYSTEDETVPQNLTAEDLKGLSLTALGHRRNLPDAIAALRSDASGKTAAVWLATPSKR